MKAETTFTHTDYLDRDHECHLIVEGSVDCDPNWGADRDGRRGASMLFTQVDQLDVFLDGQRVSDSAFTDAEWGDIEDRASEALLDAYRELERYGPDWLEDGRYDD